METGRQSFNGVRGLRAIIWLVLLGLVCGCLTSCQTFQQIQGVFYEDFNGTCVGNDYGITYVPSPCDQAALFSHESESRVEYPFNAGFPTQGTLEMWVYVTSGYSYNDYAFQMSTDGATLFSTFNGGADVWWPGSTRMSVTSDGDISIWTSTDMYVNPGQGTTAENTSFRFNEWHSIGFSFGSQGQWIVLDGQIVASNPDNTQELGAGGTHRTPNDQPTLGEGVSGFWENNQYDSGFEGMVDKFRVSSAQMDWVLSMETCVPVEQEGELNMEGEPQN